MSCSTTLQPLTLWSILPTKLQLHSWVQPDVNVDVSGLLDVYQKLLLKPDWKEDTVTILFDPVSPSAVLLWLVATVLTSQNEEKHFNEHSGIEYFEYNIIYKCVSW